MNKITDFKLAWDFLNTHEAFRVYYDYEPVHPLTDQEYEDHVKRYEESEGKAFRPLDPTFLKDSTQNIYDDFRAMGENGKILEDHHNSDSKFQKCLDIDVVMINPENGYIDSDKSKNTQIEILLECGMLEDGSPAHDIELDCGGYTFEEAIINLANLVIEHYPEETEKTIMIDDLKQYFNFRELIMGDNTNE